jgi:pantoate--beta-alanine ligase
VAIFGEKDYQQAAVIKRMVRDLNFPLKIVVSSTVRETDGLAMSSRNSYLNESERKQATALYRVIQYAKKAVSTKRSINADDLKKELKSLIEKEPSARVDYIEFFNSETLQPVPKVSAGTHLALAVFIGKTRLIDNASL